MDALSTAKTNFTTASDDQAKLTQDIPGLLSGLKSNLTSIFTKDNPMFQDRENALNTFLNTPSQTRASLLPGNLPVVEGSNLNLSPTQQNAIVTARSNAALVPLAGLNQSIVGQYGNLGDILHNAGGIYQTQAEVAKQRAQNALELYKQEVELEKQRISSASNGGAGLGDLSSLLSLLLTQNQQEKPPGGDWEVVPTETNTFKGSQPLNLGGSTTLPSGLTIPNIGPNGQPIASGLNLGNIPIHLGASSSNGLSLAGLTPNSLSSTGLRLNI